MTRTEGVASVMHVRAPAGLPEPAYREVLELVTEISPVVQALPPGAAVVELRGALRYFGVTALRLAERAGAVAGPPVGRSADRAHPGVGGGGHRVFAGRLGFHVFAALAGFITPGRRGDGGPARRRRRRATQPLGPRSPRPRPAVLSHPLPFLCSSCCGARPGA